MGPILEALHKLQEIERRIAAIRSKADGRRRRIQLHQRALQKQEAIIEEKNAVIRDRRMEIDRIDLDLKAREEFLCKHREALNRAKTNKEYAAILTTLNSEKADSAKQESCQLQVMTDLDDQRAEAEASIAERNRMAERIADAQSDLEQYLEDHAKETKDLDQQRSAASEEVSPSILTTFRRVADKHEGQAMGEVTVLNAKRNEYACGGCNIAITLEAVLALRARDELQMCPSCGMILYLPAR